MSKIRKEENPGWLQWIVPERFNNPELFKIVIFFVFHSPCKDSSAMRRSLQEYGWSDKPWFKPEELKFKLLKCIGSFNETPRKQILFSANNADEMDEKLKSADLLDNFPSNLDYERVAFVNSKENQFMSVFAHIRNSLAHGRLNMREIPETNDFFFIMEDVNRAGSVTSRMILKKSTLLKWIDLIEKVIEK